MDIFLIKHKFILIIFYEMYIAFFNHILIVITYNI